MFKAMVWCKTGVATSLMLKIKVDQVITENNFPIATEAGSEDKVKDFDGDLLISLSDLAHGLKHAAPYVIGVDNIIDGGEIKRKLAEFLTKRYSEEAGVAE